jgi:hypothetical protein
MAISRRETLDGTASALIAAACPASAEPVDELARLQAFKALRDAGCIEKARAIARATWPGPDMPQIIVWVELIDDHRAEYMRQQALAGWDFSNL